MVTVQCILLDSPAMFAEHPNSTLLCSIVVFISSTKQRQQSKYASNVAANGF